MNRREYIRALSGAILTLAAGGQTALAALAKPRMAVYKSPTCGCCSDWIKHVKANGFDVEEYNVIDVTPYKKKFGVPLELASCHTGIVNGYAFEGHVPADLIRRFLKAPPKNAKGLAVPGMPAGSPGMEVPGRKDAYDVVLFRKDGSRSVYARR